MTSERPADQIVGKRERGLDTRRYYHNIGRGEKAKKTFGKMISIIRRGSTDIWCHRGNKKRDRGQASFSPKMASSQIYLITRIKVTEEKKGRSYFPLAARSLQRSAEVVTLPGQKLALGREAKNMLNSNRRDTRGGGFI